MPLRVPTDSEEGGSLWSGVRQGSPRLSFRAGSVPAPGPTDPIASEEGGGGGRSPWSGVRHGLPKPLPPGVCRCTPVGGKYGTVRVCNVGGGGPL